MEDRKKYASLTEKDCFFSLKDKVKVCRRFCQRKRDYKNKDTHLNILSSFLFVFLP